MFRSWSDNSLHWPSINPPPLTSIREGAHGIRGVPYAGVHYAGLAGRVTRGSEKFELLLREKNTIDMKSNITDL